MEEHLDSPRYRDNYMVNYVVSTVDNYEEEDASASNITRGFNRNNMQQHGSPRGPGRPTTG